MIPVTKSFIPSLSDYSKCVSRAFKKEWLTNRGHLVEELESKILSLLDLENTNLICMNNGTIPLQIALKILGGEGEIITTPFSYVATTAAIVWENCKPVFVDIHPEYLTIDETKIEAAVTSKTTCILATHVFGNPCNIEVIDRIAKKYKLKVIYDAAHCFGVKYNGKSIFEYGDVSSCSFHATKIFHTGEGGAIFCKDRGLYKKLYFSHNFGHDGEYQYHGLGINGKMSELNAAMGLTVLPYFKEIVSSRETLVNYYNENLDMSLVKPIKLRASTIWNFSYFPVLFDSSKDVRNAIKILKSRSILSRRYFYPSLSKLPYVDYNFLQNAENVANNVLCLPLYHSLRLGDVAEICEIINKLKRQ